MIQSEALLKSKLSFPQPLSYKDELTKAMTFLAKDPLVVFLGYGIKFGGRAGSFRGVPDSQLQEMPVAENLLASVPIGMSMEGYKPLIFFERFDFIQNAMDAIFNHLDKMASISGGEFMPTAILRIVVGNRQKPLFTGETHTQDYSVMLRQSVSFPVIQLTDASQIQQEYQKAYESFGKHSTALVEYKDLI